MSIYISNPRITIHNYSKTYPDKVRLFTYAKPYQKTITNLETRTDIETVLTSKINKNGDMVTFFSEKEHDPYLKAHYLERILEKHKQIPQVNTKAPVKPMNEDSIKKSLNRTRTKIADLIACNAFTHFGTFTFGHLYCPNPCDKTTTNCKRFDDKLMRAKLTQFLNNEQRNGKFQYLIVPERHKSGALHFHGLFKDYPGELKNSGVLEGGRQVYNMTNFKKIGHNNFTVIESLGATANYCRKYITKDLALEKSRRRYWHSKDLQTPSLRYNDDPLELLLTSTSQPTVRAHKQDVYTIFDIPITPLSIEVRS